MTSRFDRAHIKRWGRSPKGLFAAVLLVLTIPSATAAGWALVAPLLVAAIAAAMVLDAPLIRWRDGHWTVPDGALLTGWLVALILSPHERWTVAAATAAMGIAAKHLLKVKRANVLNPAAAALVGSYFAFGSGQSWWGALAELPSAAVLLVLATGAFMAWRLHKVPVALAFLGVHFTLATLLAYTGNPAHVAELFRAPDVHMALFFAGFMLTDPPTSPPKPADQLRYGTLAAVASFALFQWVGAVYFLPGGLLVANLWEGWRKWRRQHPAAAPRPASARA